MEPVSYNNFHAQVYNFIKQASEDRLAPGALENFLNLIQQTPTRLNHDERKQLIAIGKKVENSSKTMRGKVSNLITSLFYPTIHGNPKFKQIVDIAQWAEKAGKAAEAPELRRPPLKPQLPTEIGSVLPKEYQREDLQKNMTFVRNILSKKVDPNELNSFLEYLKNKGIPLSRPQLAGLKKAVKDPTNPFFQSKELHEIIKLGTALEKVFGERLKERKEDLFSKTSHLWDCVDRERNETGGFTYIFRQKDEYNDITEGPDIAEKTRAAKTVHDRIFPAVELPASFLALFDPSLSKDDAAEKMYHGILRFYGAAPSWIRILEQFKNIDEVYELGYVLKHVHGGASGVYFSMPDRETLMLRWQEVRKRKPELPALEIHPSIGIASHISFIESFFTHDVLLSSSKEFVHDQLFHVLPTLYFMLNPLGTPFDTAEVRKQFTFEYERVRLVRLIAKEYRDLHIAKEGVKNGYFKFSVNPEQSLELIEKVEAVLGSLVDALSNKNNAEETKNITMGSSIWDVTLATPVWVNFFKDKNKSGISWFSVSELRLFVPEMKTYVNQVLNARNEKKLVERLERNLKTDSQQKSARKMAWEDPYKALSIINNNEDHELRKIGIYIIEDLIRFVSQHGKNIKSINIELHEINDSQLEAILSLLPNLERLDLTGADGLTGEGIANALKERRIKALLLRGRNDAHTILKQIGAGGQGVQYLNLDNCLGAFEKEEDVQALRTNFPNLKTLSVSEININYEKLKKMLYELKSLSIIRCSEAFRPQFQELKKAHPNIGIFLT